MANLRSGLKIFAVIIIALGLYDFIGGLVLVFANNTPEIASVILNIRGVEYTIPTAALVFGAIMIFAGLVNLLIGFLGWRGAKNPAKIGPFVWISLVGAIFTIINFIGEIINGSFTFSTAFDTLFMVVIFATAYSIRKKYRMGDV